MRKAAEFQQQEEELTDHSLLCRFREGEQDAATLLYLKYARRLQAWASSQTSQSLSTRFDSEDVVQSVFRTLFRRVTRGEYDVPPGHELWRLLLVLAANKIRKLVAFHRAQKRDVTRTKSVLHDDTAGRPILGDEVALSTLNMVIDELMTDMPEANRRIVELRIQGYKIGEIVDETDRARRSVERVLRQFRERLSAEIFEIPSQLDS